MNKNTLMFVVLSAAVIFGWFILSPQQQQQKAVSQQAAQSQESVQSSNNQTQQNVQQSQKTSAAQQNTISEQTAFIENDNYKVTLTNRGAAVLSWQIKEKNGQWVELLLNKDIPVLATINVNYKLLSKTNEKVIFEYVSPEGWKITKTYNFAHNSFMNALNIKLESLKKGAKLPTINIGWGPGLGTDAKNMKENLAETRVGALPIGKTKIEAFKNSVSQSADLFQWASIDNRYFLISFIPKNNMDFYQISSFREDKKHPYTLTLTTKNTDELVKEYSLDLYVGPKGYSYLKTYDIGLEQTVDFGFFGFLGKYAFAVLTFLYNITNNYGWSIIILTILIQILISPLTFKSFRSMAQMKKIQPMIKEIQVKYKDNQQRLSAEMMNIYKVHKVNPLGGCLPMLCQLPIFWAFFTMLRNAYELRGAQWILWVNDLSASDAFLQVGTFTVHLIPLIMGLGMFLQQKMTTATSDPTQRKMMYILPIVFTFMFWGFPSGLVLYWLTNSICSMLGQFIISRRDAIKVKKI
ncbi:MAG: membrane protein insertase YidC [Elusimicrobiota bacterium]|jgi:YidC/Oxa1 family membrane protein insertase|nr:membrane protein insertase YidC [Elusimicrobiota bacterium]